VKRARKAIAAIPGFELTPLISALDRELLRFTTKSPDRTLSQIIVPPVAALYGQAASDIYPLSVQPWIAENRVRLAELYRNYGDDLEANPIFFQPEAFLIFERVEEDPTGLKAAWPAEIPDQLLVSLTELWGDPV
jgi:hypothetical protein